MFTTTEMPIFFFSSVAQQYGLEEAIFLNSLQTMVAYRTPQNNNGYNWYTIKRDQLLATLPFWGLLDLQRLISRLRDANVLLVRSAPVSEASELFFAFNQIAKPQTRSPVVTNAPKSKEAEFISAHWKPSEDILSSLSQLAIPRQFAVELVPEFVQFWRDSGKPQRSWGAKFISYAKRQWEYKKQSEARTQSASTLPSSWAPNQQILQHISEEGIPSAFAQQSYRRFTRYHAQSGISQKDWNMAFFTWVKDDWAKQDTPFMDKRQSQPMTPHWQPAQHTLDYLRYSCAIELRFISDCIPEFVHKWTEKKAYHSEWGTLFAEHVSQQWRFVLAGVKQNPDPATLPKHWRPSADCMEVLTQQLSIPAPYIEQHVPEFILYWTNRADARHSWDNVFLHHIKHKWAKDHEQRQAPQKTRDSSITERLSDVSWAK